MDTIPSPIRVLVIDDDIKLLSLLSSYLLQFNIEVLTAHDPRVGLELLARDRVDLVVLDVLMPGMDGFETCREIRRSRDTPILMLSARGEAMDRIVGLELGADDYMAKPFEPRELAARIKTILRRTTPVERDGSILAGDLEIRTDEREAYLRGLPLGLTSMEYEVLRYLALHQGKTVGREEILRGVQGFEGGGFTRSVDILVSRIRSKLGEDARSPRFIKSVHGFGYTLIGKVQATTP